MQDTTYSKTVASATIFFDYAERYGLALFPCAAGTKRPILPWKKESSRDRKQWVQWAGAEGHNLAIDCAKSEIIVLDIDCSKVTPAEASAAYHSLCQSWGLPAGPATMTQSARGGWHVPFKRPADLAATDLRGGGTLVKISDKHLGWTMRDGKLYGVRVRRAAERMAGDGLLMKHRGDWVLTARGEKELNNLDRKIAVPSGTSAVPVLLPFPPRNAH